MPVGMTMVVTPEFCTKITVLDVVPVNKAVVTTVPDSDVPPPPPADAMVIVFPTGVRVMLVPAANVTVPVKPFKLATPAVPLPPPPVAEPEMEITPFAVVTVTEPNPIPVVRTCNPL